MSATYSIDSAHRLVRTHVRGTVTSPELDDMYARMTADPLFASSYHQLADWREVTQLKVVTDSVRAAARTHPFDAGTRRAIVVGSDVVYGVARIFAAHAEEVGQDVRVFRDMREAEEWIGIPSGA